jgi:hypothetical protein
MVYLLVVYVDDVLIIAPEKEIRRLEGCCIKEFKWVTMEIGTLHSYLGMQLEFTKGCVKIDMRSYVDGILKGFDGLKSYQGPADSRLGVVDAKRFHTVVAKLLYLSR